MRKEVFTGNRPHRVRRRLPFISGLLAATVAIIVLLVATGCSTGPTETRDDSFTVGESARLVVNSENGSIKVNASAGNELRVQATLRGADRIKYEVSQDGDRVTVSARRTGRRVLFSSSPRADITVTAPTRTDVELATSNGAIELRWTEGAGSLRSSNGNIVLKHAKRDFDGRTSNGSIEVDRMEGTGIFGTSNGEVSLREVKGEVDVETSNGRISFSGEMIAGGRNRLMTSNGKVDVQLRGTPSVSLDASTNRGQVTCALPILATVTKEDHLVGAMGEGEADLYIRTSNGNVTIK